MERFVMPMYEKCDFCNRDATRSYDNHNLCELHYLKQNPERNASWVMGRMLLSPPFRIKDRLEMLEELKKHVPLSALDEYFRKSVWYQKLKEKEGKVP